MPSTLSVRDNDFNATKGPRRSAGSSNQLVSYSFGTVVLVPVVLLVPVVEFGVAVVHGVVLLTVPVDEAVPLVDVPVVLGVFAEEVVVPLLLQSIEVPFVVVPVVGEAELVVEFVVPEAPAVPIVDPAPVVLGFCCVLGVVPVAVPIPEVEVPEVDVLGLVCGVAVLPAGEVLVVWSVIDAGEVLVVWSVIVAGVVLEPLTLPVAVEFEVCPTPAGIEAVLRTLVWPAVVPAPAVPGPVVPAVCASANAVQASASVAVIRILRMNLISSRRWIPSLSVFR